MGLFRATSIQRKLTLLVMLTTTIALLAAAVQFILNDVRDYRRRVLNDLAILTRIVGENCTSPLEFSDVKEAAHTLSALGAKPHVLAAAVYSKDGSLFAAYAPQGRTANVPLQAPPSAEERFLGRKVILSQPLLHNANPVGSIYLEFDLVEIWQRVAQDFVMVALMLLISGLIALVVTARLQRFISKPILDLAGLANVVSEKRDYSVRATKQTNDELGFLIDCFNGMLSRIEEHEKKLREVNEQLAKSEQRALAATEAKSQFLANMSHELRTPLNAIIGYAEMVQEELIEAGQNQFVPDLQRIHSAAKHQLGLINDILDLSKIEAGKMNLFLEDFDIAAAVRDVATTVQPLVARHGNRLELDCPDHLGMIRADQTKVRQVLFNLLSNATKFTENGTIKLHVARSNGEPGPALVGDRARPHASPLADRALPTPWPAGDLRPFVTFRVSDTGIGMSFEQLGRLFQAFSQASSSTTRKYGGTGLGLALSRRFCQMMGGDITASSELGKGSTFTVTLPAEVPEPYRAPHHESAPATPAPLESARTSRPTILVIDDEPAARDLVYRALSKEGYQVQTANSGPEGLNLARKVKPAAITLDVMMPGMDGWAVLSALKADRHTADIPVVMVTVVDDKNLGFALGAADYLIKPIQWDRLIAVLEKIRAQKVGGHLLIVEDEPQTREIIRRAAQRQGWKVIEAENGRAGLERVAERVPGVILLDLMMPEMNGFEFLEELRRRPDCREIPVIVVTAKDLSDEDRRRLNGHVVKILQKGGYSTRQLLEEILEQLTAAAHCAKDI